MKIHLSVFKTKVTARGGEKPDARIRIIIRAVQASRCQAAVVVKAPDLPVLDLQNTARNRAHPEVGIAVLIEINDTITGQAGSVVLVENGEAVAIEPHQTVKGAEPQVTVPRLNDGDDRAFRQPLLHAPGMD